MNFKIRGSNKEKDIGGIRIYEIFFKEKYLKYFDLIFIFR